jgi:hypothetical protein
MPANNPGTENGAAGLAAAAGADAVAGAGTGALVCGARAGATAAAVLAGLVAFGLLPGTGLLEDDMGLEPNRFKFSQNLAAESELRRSRRICRILHFRADKSINMALS